MTKEMKNNFGNPSAIYSEGKSAKVALDGARRSLAQLLNCTAKRIIFTGGGSEANNFALKGAVFSNWNSNKKHIITTTIEHPAILETCQWLETIGCSVTYLEVNSDGMITPDDLRNAITDETLLITIMMANNETGAIQSIKELAKVASEKSVYFHTDATQAVGKIQVDVNLLGVDMLTLSGHKFYGPKGVGALFVKKGIELDPLIHGGKQEQSLRAGTENLINIIGLGKAAELAGQHLSDLDNTEMLRNKLQTGILELYPDGFVNCDKADRLPNTLSIVLPGIRGESLTLALDQKGISISSGSACRSGSPKPSHALLALGLSEEDAHCTIRLSLGSKNSSDDIDITLAVLKKIINDKKSMVRFAPCR